MTLWLDFLGFESLVLPASGTRVLRGPRGSSRRAIVLLHGRGGHSETFHRNVAALAEIRDVYCLDLLGHGLSEQRGQRYDVGELLVAVDAAIDELGLDDFDLLGQSLGGWVALQLALQKRRGLGRLVLVEPAGLQSEGERMADPRVAAAFEKGGRAFEAPTRETVRLRFEQLLYDKRGIDPEMVELRYQLYSLEGAGEIHRLVRGADNSRWLLDDAALATIGNPTLLLRGEHGHIPEERIGSAAAALTEGEYLVIPGAKQWPHYENFGDTNDAILRFLEKEKP